MPYENIPGAHSAYLDGAFKTSSGSSQPKILVLGAGTSGLTYETFRVGAVSEAEREFGVASELLKKVHEVMAQGADNIFLMRLGGTQGYVEIVETTTGATLKITPEYRDDTILDRYTLILESDAAGEQRVLIYDIDEEEFVYDSEEIQCINTEVIRVEIDATFTDWTTGDILDPANAVALGDLVTGDFTAVNGSTDTVASVTAVDGTDGTGMTLPERYAALAEAYHMLDFRDGDIVVPCGVQIDAANQAAGDSPDYSAGLPTLGAAGDALGLVWHYIHKGKLHTYMIEDSTVLADSAEGVWGTGVGVATFTAVATGPASEAVKILFVDDVLAAAETVSVAGSTITIHFEDGVSTVAQVKTAFDAVAGAVALAAMVATTPGALTVAASDLLAARALVLPGVLTHEQLTGDVISAAVVARWQAAVSSEFRECNFAHQLAVFCWLASTTWKTMIGVVSTTGPTSYSRPDVADWVGVLPDYTQIGLDLAVDATSDNGTGLLGIKVLAGEAAYRDALVVDGNTTDGYAYGGLILTKADSLPNGSTFPYGILDTDEAVDSGGRPVDIGKHIVVSYDQPKHRNSFNGGTSYRGDMAGTLAGKLALTPVNRDPIGIENGLVLKVSDPPRVHATQMNDLAKLRMTGLRREEGVGLIIVSAKTAAHPDSDWTNTSTIRSMNKILEGIRSIAKRYIGGPYSPAQIVSLQTAIDGYLQAEKLLGTHSGAKAGISYSRTDKILGKLRIKVRAVPPGSIQDITTTISLAADESEL